VSLVVLVLSLAVGKELLVFVVNEVVIAVLLVLVVAVVMLVIREVSVAVAVMVVGVTAERISTDSASFLRSIPCVALLWAVLLGGRS
jgi:hypothetical protein